jgi:DNA-binding XRE family transcriptional regulator
MRMKTRKKNIELIIAMNKLEHNANSLAASCGVHPNTISRIINNRCTPSIGTAKKIAKILKCSIKSLFPETYKRSHGG